jgi:hypothetical protein
LKWEEHLESGFYYKLLEMGKIRPEDEEPEIEPFQFYVEAYYELSTCRSGLSISAIPFSAINDYAIIYNVEDFEEFRYYIRAIDAAILKFERAKDGTNNNKNSKNRVGSIRR